jgi:hypothetical protein
MNQISLCHLTESRITVVVLEGPKTNMFISGLGSITLHICTQFDSSIPATEIFSATGPVGNLTHAPTARCPETFVTRYQLEAR